MKQSKVLKMLKIPVPFAHFFTITLANVENMLYRCKTKPADLPKRATLPASKSDNMSYLDEEIVSRGSSNSKASHEDSLSGFSNGSKKTEDSYVEKYRGDDQEEECVWSE